MNDERSRREKVLRERAERLARPQVGSTRVLLYPIAVMMVGEDKIGFPVHQLRELLATPRITPLPGLPRWLLGVTQVRGEIISVVHLGRWLGAAEGSNPSCLVVLEGSRGALGFLADQNVGFRDIYEDDVAKDVDLRKRWPYIHCVTQDLCVVMDVPGILQDPRLVISSDTALEKQFE